MLDWTLAGRKSSPVLRRLAQLLIVLALTASIGGHWALLQTVAWAGMLATNLQRTTVVQAVSETFDGEHPCALCKGIAAGKKSEQKPDAPEFKTKKPELAGVTGGFQFCAPTAFWLAGAPVQFFASLSTAPPVPPPRVCAT